MKEIIHTDEAPKAIGPYSQAVKVGNMVYTAGQVALDAKTGELNNSTLEEEVNQIMQNLGKILNAAGSSFDQVVKTTIFLSDLNNYREVNQIYGQYFDQDPPARSTVEVAKLPKEVRVEIEFIAYCP